MGWYHLKERKRLEDVINLPQRWLGINMFICINSKIWKHFEKAKHSQIEDQGGIWKSVSFESK